MNTSLFKYFLIALCLTLLSPASAQKLDRIAVIVNDNIITKQELETRLGRIVKQIRESNTRLPPISILRKQVLEREIVKDIQLQLAKATGILVDDNELNNTITKIAASNNLSIRDFREALEQEDYPFAAYREDLRDDMIIAQLKQREIHNRIAITEQEINNFLTTQAVQGSADDEFRLAHILISVPEAASAEDISQAKQKAEQVLQKLEQGDSFKQTAISLSNGQQALNGGDLGWRKPGQLPTLFASVAIRMPVGDVSHIIRSPSGFHIIKLMDKRVGKQHIVTQTKARHILMSTNELLTQTDVIARLKQLKERIENGDDFKELAHTHSEDSGSASTGGHLGWTNPGDTAPQFEAMMQKLAINEISPPFQTQFGWHIVQVLERREQDNSEAYTRSKSRDALRQRKIHEMEETWLRQLRDEAYVEYKIDL